MKDRGLYEKFSVVRTDGESGHGKKHDGCRYFVLDIDHDKHAEAALIAYAKSCQDEYPELSVDLLRVFAEARADRGPLFSHLLRGGRR